LVCPRPHFPSAEQINYERYQKVQYRCKDGTEKEKKDFVAVKVPYSEWEKELRDFWPVYIAHHNDAKWHDDDFASMRTKLPINMIAVVIDFAQNYSHEPRFENQSKYFSQVCVLRSSSNPFARCVVLIHLPSHVLSTVYRCKPPLCLLS
jgi:hypothetical protein